MEYWETANENNSTDTDNTAEAVMTQIIHHNIELLGMDRYSVAIVIPQSIDNWDVVREREMKKHPGLEWLAAPQWAYDRAAEAIGCSADDVCFMGRITSKSNADFIGIAEQFLFESADDCGSTWRIDIYKDYECVESRFVPAPEMTPENLAKNIELAASGNKVTAIEISGMRFDLES